MPPGSKGLGMGGRQTTLFASFARAPPEDGAAPPRAAPPAAPKQAKLGFSASSGARPGPGLFEAASRPEKKKSLKQGRLGQPSGVAAARPLSADCIMVDDAPHGPSPHRASSSHNLGNGDGNGRQGGGLLADQERKRKQDMELMAKFKVAAVDKKHEKLSLQEKLQKAKENLQSIFGLSSFRPLQREAVEGVLSGHDVSVCLATGGGKSLCFQLPATVLPGVTIVISPLISLMQDQVEHCQSFGIAAEMLNGQVSLASFSLSPDRSRRARCSRSCRGCS